MPSDANLSRKDFLASVLLAASSGLTGTALAQAAGAASPQDQPQIGDDITLDDLKVAQKLAGLKFTDEQLQQILGAVRNSRRAFEALRGQAINYQIEPPTIFEPWGRDASGKKSEMKPTTVRNLKKPKSDDDLAFLSVRELGYLVRTKQVSPVELTTFFLNRLKTYGDKLLCLVTLVEDRAMRMARQAEDEAMAGKFRGPLHGIPCGIKDLFAVKGYPTTWGSEPHKFQRFEYDAAVVEKLDAAGAIILAKLSMGALAQGDVWFKGRTKNPWNPEQGSSGSSAGSACATAAGLVPFAIGTETLGSIMSPSYQCRVNGLRPTYGRVSRYGAMAVSWTMDKVGPICRSAEDCAVVFSAIHGADPRDRSSVSRAFSWKPNTDLKKLKIGFLIGQNDDPKDLSRLEKDDYLRVLVGLGAKPIPIKIDPTPQGTNLVLGVEAAAAFDEFTRSESINELKNSAWPVTYRSNRFVPAVEYLQAQRARWLLMRRFEEQLADFDLVVANERGGQTLLITNLTGHPQAIIPNGTMQRTAPTTEGAAPQTPQEIPRSVSFIGRLYGESTILAVANKVQLALGHHLKRPDLSKV